MWNNVKSLWFEMPLFRYTSTFSAVGVIIIFFKIL